jgi:hypothetical protein
MSRWFNGEVLFGLFMITVFLAGAYDLLSEGGLSAALYDSGILFALFVILLSVALLIAVILSPKARDAAGVAFMGRRGVVISLVGLSYPLLFWAAEYLIATLVVSLVALALFTEGFGRKQILLGLGFTLGSYLLFFFLLGITEADGALISTGLNDVMPTWRRDFFNAF